MTKPCTVAPNLDCLDGCECVFVDCKRYPWTWKALPISDNDKAFLNGRFGKTLNIQEALNDLLAPTPRSDAHFDAQRSAHCVVHHWYKFAKQLERELSDDEAIRELAAEPKAKNEL